MNNGISEENIKVRYSDMDYDTVLKPSALLLFLQDLASDNADSLDFGYKFVRKHNCAWYLLKYRIEFNDYPKGVQKLLFTTNPRGCNKLFAFRDFEIIHNDKIIGRAASTWAMVDLKTKSMTNVSELLKACPYMHKYEKREHDLVYGKVRTPERIDKEQIFDIRFDDLDVNRHVNNANYISWAYEPLGFDFRMKYKPKTIDIVFKKEIAYGNKVLVQAEIDDNKTFCAAKNYETGDDLCLISTEWAEK